NTGDRPDFAMAGIMTDTRGDGASLVSNMTSIYGNFTYTTVTTSTPLQRRFPAGNKCGATLFNSIISDFNLTSQYPWCQANFGDPIPQCASVYVGSSPSQFEVPGMNFSDPGSAAFDRWSDLWNAGFIGCRGLCASRAVRPIICHHEPLSHLLSIRKSRDNTYTIVKVYNTSKTDPIYERVYQYWGNEKLLYDSSFFSVADNLFRDAYQTAITNFDRNNPRPVIGGEESLSDAVTYLMTATAGTKQHFIARIRN
ncbi:hypothetical protein HK102_001581, partial [Quaeritorhiza haematococci]